MTYANSGVSQSWIFLRTIRKKKPLMLVASFRAISHITSGVVYCVGANTENIDEKHL